MKHRTQYFIILYLLICFCLVTLVFIPGCEQHKTQDPQVIDQTMYCVEIKPDGSTVRMGTFELHATIETNDEGEAYISLPSLTIDCFTFTTIASNKSRAELIFRDTYPYHQAMITGLVEPFAEACGAWLFLSYDFNYFMVKTDERTFVASIADNLDPSVILTHFSQVSHPNSGTTNPVTTTTQVPTVPTIPICGEINWRLDTKMVTSDGQLISNGTMRMEGSIVKQEDSQDLLLLNISLPATVHYRFTDHSQSEEGFYLVETELPYYVSMGYCYSITDNAQVFYQFALDIEKGYLIIQWENLPGQFLIASRDTEADPAVILAYFQGFLDQFAKDK